VYGSGKSLGSIESKPQKLTTAPAEASKLAQTLLERTGDKGGHALIFGANDMGLLDALLSDSQMQITVVEQDAMKVDALRRQYDALGLQGTRITFHVGDALSFQAPPYFAHLVIAEAACRCRLCLRAALWRCDAL
jgi:hypothetical protein